MSFNIWEGIYKNFAECPNEGGGFSSERWVTQQTERINNLKEKIKASPESAVGYRTSLLPVVAAMSGNNAKKDKIKVLDFGGGLGDTYLLMTCGCAGQIEFEFFIVEAEELCKKGRELFKNNKNINFFDKLPKDMENFDIIHLGSSIQYIEDWKGLIKEFTKYKPEYILFADVPAGQIPTYATLQNYYGSKMPHWFFNIDEFVNALYSVNYDLLFKSAFIGPRLGIIQPMPQDNFPQEYRLGETCNLLFVRRCI
jgi:putative methyltransferase (TIGR04325 family)